MTATNVYCVSGIDTDIGKTVVTGLLARSFRQHGKNVITQKIVQTGCVGISEDVLLHRKLMGIEPLAIDLKGLTCPYVFSVPCSPHLAARLDGRCIEEEVLTRQTLSLSSSYDTVFLEGAGGLLVPLNEQITFLDYLQRRKYPIILVTSSRLGSINHTLSSLEILHKRRMPLRALIYNISTNTDPRIVCDSRDIFSKYLKKYNFLCPLVDLLHLNSYERLSSVPDFYLALSNN